MYPPSRNVGDSPTNENSPFQIGLESSEIPGLYKPAVPDQQQDTLTRTFRARSSGSGPSSPIRTFRARSSGSGPRAGIVYPLQPRGRRLDTHITVDAALVEPAALQRPDLPNPGRLSSPRSLLQPADELLGNLPGSADETAQLRYSGQPNAHLHGGIGVTNKSLFL